MRNEYEKTVLRLLAGRDFIATEEVAGLIGASPATARRLINRLAENRLLRRVHGGIRPLPPESNPSIPFGLREQWFSEEKRLLAAEALKLVRRDSVLFIHGGSTTACLGSGIESGSVITNSLRLAELLRERFPADDGPEVIVPGGTLDRQSRHPDRNACRTGDRAATMPTRYSFRRAASTPKAYSTQATPPQGSPGR